MGVRRIRILEAMIDNHMISNSIASQDLQLNEMDKWDDSALSTMERMLKIPTPQKMKVGESKSDKQMIGSRKVYENGAVLSAKDRAWAEGVAEKYEANLEHYFPKKKVGE